MNRPKVSVFLALSLDGYIAGENNDLAWLMEYSTDPPESTGYTALIDSIDVLVLGRNSYDLVSTFNHWLYEGLKVVVLTHRPLVPHHGEEAYDGPLESLLELLAGRGCRHVYLDGGQAARQAFELGLVDELTLSWVPVILGRGIPLFTPGPLRSRWRLTDSRSLPSGLLQAVYVPNRADKRGGF